MTEAALLRIGQWAMATGLEVAAPVLIVALVSGTLVSILLATTQVQEFTLTFVPKIIAIALACAFFGPWMLRVMIRFGVELLSELPTLAR
jgi:flagellar biosynthesis protein FliQ